MTADEDEDEELEAPTLIEARSEELTRALSADDLAELTPAEPAPLPAAADPHAWFLGRSFGGFRIVCALASGGMATVFLGRKEGPARISKYAAIKVVHPHLAFERDFVNMFLDEARIAALIDHPNVCSVLDFGMAEGTYYLAMEYLLGETWSSVRAALAEHPDGVRMLPGISAHVLSQACEGLHAAHEAVDGHGRPLHIVHRDISPQNIFVAYDGTVRVLDFGIARAADRITLTRDGTLKGRLAYMSPEQMSVAEVGQRADIWSMGVVLREALEGKRLFRRSTDAETMLAVTHEPMPEWIVEPPLALRAIADRALSRDPSGRPATAHDMAAELARVAASTRRPVGTSELSVWMGLLFATQMEQKRALLQLSIPTPISDRAQPWPAAPNAAELEPSSGTRAPATIPARAAKGSSGSLRPRWINVSALIALASVGSIAGLLLGRVARREHAPVVLEEGIQKEAPSVAPLPSVAQLPSVAPGVGAGVDRQGGEEGAEEDQVEEDGERGGPSRSPSTPTSPSTSTSTAGGGRREHEEVTGETGTVLVAFEGGWAEVYSGSQLLGTTPGRFTLPAGKHTLRIRPFGTGKALAKRVEVTPGATVKLFLGAPSL